MSRKFKGGITLVKVANSRTLSLNFTVNQPITQDVDLTERTATPDWSASPYLVILPVLEAEGISGNAITQVESTPVWKINGSTDLTIFGATVGSSSENYKLTIKKNLIDVSSLKIEFSAVFDDPEYSGVNIPINKSISFARTLKSASLLSTSFVYENGANFTNEIDVLNIECEFKRGEVVETNPSTYSIRWFEKLNSDWIEISIDNAGGIEGFTTNKLTIPIKEVPTKLSLKCEITDKLENSLTYNQTIINETLIRNKESIVQVNVMENTIDLPNVGVNLLNNDWSSIGATPSVTGDRTIKATSTATSFPRIQCLNLEDLPYKKGDMFSISYEIRSDRPRLISDNGLRSTHTIDVQITHSVSATTEWQQVRVTGVLAFDLVDPFVQLYSSERGASNPDAWTEYRNVELTRGATNDDVGPSINEGGVYPDASIRYSLSSVPGSGRVDTGIKISDIESYFIKYRVTKATSGGGVYGGYDLRRSINADTSFFKAGAKDLITKPLVLTEWQTESLTKGTIYENGAKLTDYVPDPSVVNLLPDGNGVTMSSSGSSVLEIINETMFNTNSAKRVKSTGGTSVTKAVATLISAIDTTSPLNVSYSLDVKNNSTSEAINVYANYPGKEITVAAGETKKVNILDINRQVGGSNVMLMFQGSSSSSEIDVTYANVLLVEGPTVGNYEDSISTFELYGAVTLPDCSDIEIAQCEIVTKNGTVHEFIPVQIGDTSLMWLDTATNDPKFSNGTVALASGAKITEKTYLKPQLIQDGKIIEGYKRDKFNYGWTATDKDGDPVNFFSTPSLESQIVGIDTKNQIQTLVNLEVYYK